jgi:hypothetical protein
MYTVPLEDHANSATGERIFPMRILEQVIIAMRQLLEKNEFLAFARGYSELVAGVDIRDKNHNFENVTSFQNVCFKNADGQKLLEQVLGTCSGLLCRGFTYNVVGCYQVYLG